MSVIAASARARSGGDAKMPRLLQGKEGVINVIGHMGWSQTSADQMMKSIGNVGEGETETIVTMIEIG